MLEDERENLGYQALLDYSQTTSHKIGKLIEDQMRQNLTIALTLAQNTNLQEFLTPHSQVKSVELSPLIRQFDAHVNLHNLWVHLVDAKGVSRYRSWTAKKDDSLLDVRKDLRDFIVHPRVQTSISVGIYALSLKAMVPLYSPDGNFVGSVEIISQLNSVLKNLTREGFMSALIIDPKFKSQLTGVTQENFVGDFFMLTDNSRADLRSALVMRDLQEIYQLDQFDYNYQQQLLTLNYPITSNDGEKLGSIVLIKKIVLDDLINLERTFANFNFIIWVLVVSTLFVILVYAYWGRRLTQAKEYYSHILDVTPEIIFVTNTKKIIQINQRFLEFFNIFNSLEAFRQQHRSVSEIFVEEDGFLREFMGDHVYWLDYVANNPGELHKAKIHWGAKDYIFLIKVRYFKNSSEKQYTVVMQDISDAEAYKARLEHLTQTDTLTQIGNRLAFNGQIVREIDRAMRYGTTFSLLMFDVDFFKKINDVYGHDVGDKVLIGLAALVQDYLRGSDGFYRIGGEEFMVLMPETNGKAACILAERLRNRVELQEFYADLKVTISQGLTQYEFRDTPESLMKRVDVALYQSKNHGRNQTTQLSSSQMYDLQQQSEANAALPE